MKQMIIDPYCENCEDVTKIVVRPCGWGRCEGTTDDGCEELVAECQVCGFLISSNCGHR